MAENGEPGLDQGIHPITAGELLNVWELGHNRPPLEQGALLLLLAFPRLGRKNLDQLAVGQRTSLLLQLRQRLFGSRLDGLSDCPACGEMAEFTLEIPHQTPDLSSTPGPVDITVGEYHLTVRPLTGTDLVQAAADPFSLWRRCLVNSENNGKTIAPDELPDLLEEKVAAALQSADPLADIVVKLNCPACQHIWQAPLDVTRFLMAELEKWARKTLHIVSLLAAAYHWREADILRMSAWRRDYYLELAGR